MDAVKDIATFVALIAALWGLFKGVVEFNLQGRQKRAEIFLKKQNEYFGNKAFNEIRTLLEIDSVELRDRPFEEKRAYLTFFEEIAILKNSGLLNADLVYYMYGYYCVRCCDSINFWSNISKDEIFWNVFLTLARDMKTRLQEKQEVVTHKIEV